MSKLVQNINLTPAQQPKVGSAVADYLTQKAGIIGLQKSNAKEYAQKQSGLLEGLKSKLTAVLLKDQMNKFLGMKPATNDPTNVLSQLFF